MKTFKMQQKGLLELLKCKAFSFQLQSLCGLCHAVFNLLFNIESGIGNPRAQIACKQPGVQLCDLDANVGSPLAEGSPLLTPASGPRCHAQARSGEVGPSPMAPAHGGLARGWR